MKKLIIISLILVLTNLAFAGVREGEDNNKRRNILIDSVPINIENKSLIIPILSELGMGTLCGLVASIPFGLAGQNVLIWYQGYTLGTAYGVNLIAQKYNSNVTFGKTLLASLVGDGMGVLLWQLSGQKGPLSVIAFFVPTLTSIIYANLIEEKDTTTDKINVSYLPVVKNKSVIHTLQLTILL